MQHAKTQGARRRKTSWFKREAIVMTALLLFPLLSGLLLALFGPWLLYHPG